MSQELLIANRRLQEQNEKLQGTIYYLKADIEALKNKYEKAKEREKEYKDAFNDVFIHTVGDFYDKIPKDKQEKMTINEKINFQHTYFSRTILILKDINKKTKEDFAEKEKDLLKKIDDLEKRIKISEEFVFTPQEDYNKKEAEEKKEVPKTTSNNDSWMKKQVEKNKENEIKQNQEHEKKETPEELKKFNIISNALNSTKNTAPSEPPQEKNTNGVSSLPLTTKKSNLVVDTKKLWDEELTNEEKKYTIDFNIDALSPREKILLISFGETGFYKARDHLNYIIKNTKNTTGEEFNNNRLYETLKQLIEKNIIVNADLIEATGRGKPSGVYQLTNVGYILFKKIKLVNPVASLISSLVKEHKSLNHGDAILEIKKILEERNYQVILEDKQTTSTGKTSICDLLATQGGYLSFRIEYEEGNYSEEKYFEKFTNIIDVTPNIRFVVRNKDVQNKLIRCFDRWLSQTFSSSEGYVNPRKAFMDKGYTILIVTLEDLKRLESFPLR